MNSKTKQASDALRAAFGNFEKPTTQSTDRKKANKAFQDAIRGYTPKEVTEELNKSKMIYVNQNKGGDNNDL